MCSKKKNAQRWVPCAVRHDYHGHDRGLQNRGAVPTAARRPRTTHGLRRVGKRMHFLAHAVGDHAGAVRRSTLLSQWAPALRLHRSPKHDLSLEILGHRFFPGYLFLNSWMRCSIYLERLCFPCQLVQSSWHAAFRTRRCDCILFYWSSVWDRGSQNHGVVPDPARRPRHTVAPHSQKDVPSSRRWWVTAWALRAVQRDYHRQWPRAAKLRPLHSQKDAPFSRGWWASCAVRQDYHNQWLRNAKSQMRHMIYAAQAKGCPI
jgi:hypothetical protein